MPAREWGKSTVGGELSLQRESRADLGICRQFRRARAVVFKLQCEYESPGRSGAHEFGVLTCSQVVEMSLVQGSHFANHWARAQEASEKEGVGSESKDHIMEDLTTNVKNLDLRQR